MSISLAERVISDSTEMTYTYCLSHWFSFVNEPWGTQFDSYSFEQNVLSFVDDFRKRGCSVATVMQHISALCHQYGSGNVKTDKVRAALEKYRRSLGRPSKKQDAIGLEMLVDMLIPCESARDRAVLTVGWAGALRAGEIVAIRRDDLSVVPEGFILTIPRSKTDQFGAGKQIPLPQYHYDYMGICPARALKFYLSRQSDFFVEPEANYRLFPVCTRTISRIVSKYAELAGFVGAYTSHSLRRGLATTAAQHGIEDRVIMRHGRWMSRDVFEGYVAEGTMWQRTALDFLR